MSTETPNFRLSALVADIRQYSQDNWQVLASAQSFFKKRFGHSPRSYQRNPSNSPQIFIARAQRSDDHSSEESQPCRPPSGSADEQPDCSQNPHRIHDNTIPPALQHGGYLVSAVLPNVRIVCSCVIEPDRKNVFSNLRMFEPLAALVGEDNQI